MASTWRVVPDGPGGAPPAGATWMEVDWRAHQRWVTVDSGPVNLIDVGSGPPLLLVHGLSGSWQNWLENVLALAVRHRVLAVDLPGFGASPLPRDDISITGYAHTLNAVCDALGIGEPAAVAGNSMGGFVGAELAIVAPERVERLVLVAAAGLTTAQLGDDRRLAALRRAENVLAFCAGWTATRSEVLSRRPRLRRALMGMVVKHPEALPAPLIAEQIRGSGKPGFYPALDAILGFPLRDRLEGVGCPTLVVWGDSDQLVPLRDADEFVRLVDDARKIVYEDTGHMPMLERPERFNADLLAFLGEQVA